MLESNFVWVILRSDIRNTYHNRILYGALQYTYSCTWWSKNLENTVKFGIWALVFSFCLAYLPIGVTKDFAGITDLHLKFGTFKFFKPLAPIFLQFDSSYCKSHVSMWCFMYLCHTWDLLCNLFLPIIQIVLYDSQNTQEFCSCLEPFAGLLQENDN